MASRTDLLLRLDCPECGGLMAISTAAPAQGFVFACPQGHTATSAQLRERRLEDIEKGLHRVLAGWQEKTALLEKIAGKAKDRGYDQIARNLQIEHDRLRDRTDQVERRLREEETPPPAGEKHA
jgi:hypothetical protein